MSTERTTEILHYLSAMSRDIGEFRTETRTQISELRTEMRTGFGELRVEIREARAEVSAIASRLYRLEARVLDNRADVRDLDARVKVLEGGQT
jgi:hypothetical protein